MFGSSWKGALLPGTFAAAFAAPAHAVDMSRLDLLAGEAVSVMGHSAAAPSRLGLLVLIGIPLATMVAAYLGTYLGIRGLSFGSLRHHEGWREVAYRFRSEEPMTVGKDVIKRMSGVLDDIEELGRNIRSRSAKPAAPVEPSRKQEPEEAPAPRMRAGRSDGRKAAPVVDPEPVTFVRRAEPAPVADAPREAAVEDVPPPQPIARATGGDTDRSARYRRARALLDAGHDRESVRSMTGLKLAEVDLLRCAGAPGGNP